MKVYFTTNIIYFSLILGLFFKSAFSGIEHFHFDLEKGVKKFKPIKQAKGVCQVRGSITCACPMYRNRVKETEFPFVCLLIN